MKSKRGAVELSITTIIVVVIGITLLVLGLAWVQGIFSQLDKLTGEQFTSAQKKIQESMGADARFYVSGNAFNVKSGEKVEVYVGVQNFGTQGTNDFLIEVQPGKNAEGKFVITTSEERVQVKVGDRAGIPVIIRANKGLNTGTDYSFIIKAIRDGNKEIPYDSQAILVTVI